MSTRTLRGSTGQFEDAGVPGMPRGSFSSPADSVARAKSLLELERNVGRVSESLFDAIVANEFAPAASLVTRMLGDYVEAVDTVFAAFERAKGEFSSYDGSGSPRSWVLGYVLDELARRARLDGGPIDNRPA